MSDQQQVDLEQVIAVDRKFEIFERSLCVVEIAKAHIIEHIPQSLKVLSLENINANEHKLTAIDVNECKVSRPEDKAHILGEILTWTTTKQFNQNLITLIGGMVSKIKARETRKSFEAQPSSVARLAGLRLGDF